MVTGNTVERLNSEATPSQPEAQPERKDDNLRPVKEPSSDVTAIAYRNRSNCQGRLTVLQTRDQWRTDRHNRKQNASIGRSPANSGSGNVEDRRTHLDSRN